MTDETGETPAELISRARAGDRDALDRLFRQYQRYLTLVIRSAMGPVMRRNLDVADVLQETFLTASARFDHFHGEDEREFVAWMRALASRKLIDLARRMGRAKRQPASQVSLDQSDGGKHRPLREELVSDGTSPSRAAERRELKVRLADALSQLPNEQAEVVWLRHVDGLSFEAIAEKLGVGRNAVRGMWARALCQLRGMLPDDARER